LNVSNMRVLIDDTFR